MTRYSQHDEQEFILTYFKRRTHGYFLDIGAGDGVNDSNTRALWELGWSGILIEPNRYAFAQLLHVYGDGVRAMLVNAAICDRNGFVPFFEHPVTGWSSLDPKLGDFNDYRGRHVLGLKLETLNIQHPIHFLSVDAEGKDAEILASLPENIQPELIMAESDKNTDPGAILAKRGYHEVWHNEANVAYAKSG